jgi:hypothetical protein
VGGERGERVSREDDWAKEAKLFLAAKQALPMPLSDDDVGLKLTSFAGLEL